MGNHAKQEHSSDMQEFQLIRYMQSRDCLYRKNENMYRGYIYFVHCLHNPTKMHSNAEKWLVKNAACLKYLPDISAMCFNLGKSCNIQNILNQDPPKIFFWWN